MAYQLKCKAIALAEESKAFKKQEDRATRLANKWEARAKSGRAKAQRLIQQGIHLHRVKDIRKEARNALLAYGFLNGLQYAEMERFAWTQPNWERVKKLAVRYSDKPEQVITQSFAEWQDTALNGVEPKWKETLVPGSVKSPMYDLDWVNMQLHRNADRPYPGKGSVMIIESSDEESRKVSFTRRVINLFGGFRKPYKLKERQAKKA